MTVIMRCSKATNLKTSEDLKNTIFCNNYMSFAPVDSTRNKLTSVFPVSRSDKDPDLLSSSTLSDFQIICTLAVGEFGHVDLVRVHLIAAHAQ